MTGVDSKALRALAEWAGSSWFNLPAVHPMTRLLRSKGLVRSYAHQFAPRYSLPTKEQPHAHQ